MGIDMIGRKMCLFLSRGEQQLVVLSHSFSAIHQQTEYELLSRLFHTCDDSRQHNLEPVGIFFPNLSSFKSKTSTPNTTKHITVLFSFGMCHQIFC